MKTHHIITALSVGWLAFTLSACNFTNEEKEQMIKSKNGKDFFRDSEKWGKVTTRSLSLGEFTHIVMDGNADIHLRQGEEFLVEVTGNEKAIDANSIQVENGKKDGETVLHVAAKERNLNSLPSIKIDVTVPDIRGVQVNGEGDFDIKGEAFFDGDLTIVINGDGDVEATTVGCDALSITINGDGDMTAKKFKCTRTEIQMNGNGDITTDVKADNITLQLSGDGEADLDVKCENLNISAGGNGEVKLKGKCKNLTKQTFGKASLDSRRLQVSGDIKIK